MHLLWTEFSPQGSLTKKGDCWVFPPVLSKSGKRATVLRRGGTGQYNKHYEEGVYECEGCGTPLYKSTTKFGSGCGWPAFFEGLPGAITETHDADGRRIEITCTACGGHMGHVFKGEGFKTPTDARHCINSVSLKFTPANK